MRSGTASSEKTFNRAGRQQKTMKLYMTVFFALSLFVMPVLASCRQPLPGAASEPKAAIIDQISVLEPDSGFVAKATAMLESAGFKVDVWQGKAVTVDFYRSLPQYGYKLIIFRVHSGILLSVEGSKVVPLKTTYLFTSEAYRTGKYISEQLSDDKVSPAMMSDKYPLVFAVNSQFVADDFKGTFDNTVILSMGCESSYIDDMATAFIQKGASAYVGWSTVVSLDYVDNATLDLLGNLFLKNMTVAQGIASTMADVGTDPYFQAYLKMHPTDRGNQTINTLVR